MTSSKVCSSCVNGCMHCLNPVKCKMCKFGYFMENDLCYDCPENCKTCSSASICVECNNGFAINADTKECDLSCIEYCSECGENSACKE
jgi:hypothetical protein